LVHVDLLGSSRPGSSWHIANNAVLTHAQSALLEDSHRFDGMEVVGVDEHVWNTYTASPWIPQLHALHHPQPHPRRTPQKSPDNKHLNAPINPTYNTLKRLIANEGVGGS